MNWNNLRDYKCPKCEGELKEKVIQATLTLPSYLIHHCSTCDFKIRNAKLSTIAVQRHRKLEPPEFIKELRNQEELNNL